MRGDAVRRLLLTAPAARPGNLARLRLRGIRVRGELDLADAAVATAVRLRDCVFDTAPRLDGARFEALQLTGCELPGLHAHAASTAREFELEQCTVNGTVDLRSMTVGTLLSLRDTVVRPAPGDRGHGRDADARTVLVAKQRGLRPTLPRPGRLWSVLQDVTVGFGYRPLRAVGLLVALIAAGTTLFALRHPDPVGDGPHPPFQPAIYTLDLLLPLVDLGQERHYGPAGAMQWVAVVLIGTGWLLATTVAAGAVRVLRRT
ncbi:hypothetical protein [Embleya sp. NBC_00896]|uniref:hypothetical protein n=1 Tax=Embleya sp. NBC_00896 TaxID=2975961 RepID=UPI002F9146C7|nr:hypothetical protein OG928_34210 [Embleya sp. NBC_00896]